MGGIFEKDDAANYAQTVRTLFVVTYQCLPKTAIKAVFQESHNLLLQDGRVYVDVGLPRDTRQHSLLKYSTMSGSFSDVLSKAGM